ncbi:hypothetical protein H5410_011545 [Solanum commersonii]|uniref:ER membrane protein complex subunit 2 n=1 Tax=Solanum commersonii TaxID=4109 RepID=A0A9J6AQF0_SOLCO|nr:hypothetical protein H5410_011545 [Solanum commersonii]
MVTRTEEEEVNRLENQVENGGGGVWEYLCLVHKLKLRRSDMVLKHGFSILNDSKKRSALGPEEWTLYEQVSVAAMDCQSIDVAKDCIKVLQRKFPGSKRVGRLEAMLLEARGLWSEAENAYSSLLEENPFDQVVHKRRVAMAKAQGNTSAAIDWLNKYLDLFMADHEAWRELAEIYVSLQMYKQAAFCYEELILSQPTVPLYHLAYADERWGPGRGGRIEWWQGEILNEWVLDEVEEGYDGGSRERLVRWDKGVTSWAGGVCLYGEQERVKVLYTLGGLENLQTAKKYYASTIDLTGGKSTRALFGICLCTSAIGQLTKGRNKEDKESPELQSLSAMALEKDYKQRAPSRLSVLSSTLRSLKI